MDGWTELSNRCTISKSLVDNCWAGIQYDLRDNKWFCIGVRANCQIVIIIIFAIYGVIAIGFDETIIHTHTHTQSHFDHKFFSAFNAVKTI